MHPPFWRQRKVWLIGLLLWATVLWIASSRTITSGGFHFMHADKVKHFCYFTAGGFIVGRLLLTSSLAPRHRLCLLLIFLFALLAGVLDEFHQTFTPGRNGNDLGDIIADVLGGTFGGWLALRRHLAATKSAPR